MHTLAASITPQTQETLGNYVRRLREEKGISQQQLAASSGVHPQSIGKIERGITTKLNHKTRNGLAHALAIPAEYLDAAVKGVTLETLGSLKICPHCWTPGNPPESPWNDPRAKFCFICGHSLLSQCRHCAHPIDSYQHRFCPMCGTSYKHQPQSEGVEES